MREMKDSGIKEIGLISKDYNIIKTKYLFGVGDDSLRVGPFGSTLKGKMLEEGEYKIYNQANLINSDFSLNRHFIDKSTFERLKSYEIKPGDILFSMMGTIGKCQLMPEGYPKGIMDSHLLKARPNNNIVPAFFNYVYDKDNCSIVINQLLKLSNGSIMNGLNSEIVKNLYMPLPCIQEQKKIVKFLDSKCHEIDTVTADIKDQIETLEQYKQSVITETVTKGLNPDVEMKDSGIEWVGEIPAHWKIHPIYYYFEERKHKNSHGLESNLLSLSYGNIIRKDIDSDGGLLPDSFNTYNIVEPGDIIIRPTDLQNDKHSLRTGLVKEHGIITSAYIAVKPINSVNTAYYHYLLHSYDVMKVFYNMGNGVRQGLNFSEFSCLMVFEPTRTEQDGIVAYLDAKCAGIDTIIADKQAQLDTLAEYKKSLIYEYVTGKKEVSTT